MSEQRSYRLWVGVDIAAETFTVTWGRSNTEPIKPVTLPQTPDGYTHLQQRLHQTGVAPAEVLVVMEATSSYWISLAVALHHAGFAVSVGNPTQVHNYAKSLPRRSKTDVLDAVWCEKSVHRNFPTHPVHIFTINPKGVWNG